MIIENKQERGGMFPIDQHPVTWLGGMFNILNRLYSEAPDDVTSKTNPDWTRIMGELEQHLLEAPFLNVETFKKDYDRTKALCRSLTQIVYEDRIEIRSLR